MAGANVSEIELHHDDDLAVLAAMALLGEDRWTIQNVARALGRCPTWLQNAIDEALEQSQA